MDSTAPVFSIVAVDCFERPVRYRLPFRFGAATVTDGVQAFVRARIRLPDGRESTGATAELMVPKWFDKNPARSNEDNIDDLRSSLATAAESYTSDSAARSAFGHSAVAGPASVGAAEAFGLTALAAAFGPAEVDRAIVDALCRALDLSFFDALRANLFGFAPAALAPDLDRLDAGAFVATLAPRATIGVRHTVGLLDPLDARSRRANDGLPESLEEVIDAERPRWFKVKLGGDPRADVARLVDVARALDRVTDYAVTLDGNEQYAGAPALAELFARIDREPSLRRLAAAIAFVEQPLARAATFECDVHALSARIPLAIDEADATFDAFPRARAIGYTGVSSKSCKGLYKSLANLARCRRWNAESTSKRYFVCAEDLTAPAGLALQQDLALAAIVGVAHGERNGHHYIDGFAGQCADASEADAFSHAHGDLYARAAGGVRVAVRDGELAIGSLDTPGFASAAWPRFEMLAPMRVPARAANG